MGDRTYLSVTFSKADEAKFVKACGDYMGIVPLDDADRWSTHEYEGRDHTIRFDAEEVSPCGATDELIEAGAPFVGWHAPGMEYGAYDFVFDGQNFLEVASGHDNWGFVVEVDEDGEISERDLRHIKEFRQAVEWVNFYFQIQKDKHAKNGG